jgi:hypothetical protein
MQALLTVIMTWLSVNFGLPAVDEYPRVAFVAAAQMTEARHSRLDPDQPDGAGAEFGHGVHAFYDDRSRTIFLPEGWAATTPADVSLLVHELTHHLQHVAGLTYDCPEAREAPAYGAQARWLDLFDKNLADEFGLDAMTILLRTSCMH